jgi:hypothetical protein
MFQFILKKLTIIDAGNELQTPTTYPITDELQTPMNYPATAVFVTNYKINNHRGKQSLRLCVFCKNLTRVQLVAQSKLVQTELTL